MTTIGQTTHFFPQSRCPSCGKKLDACEMLNGDNKPDPGDVSVCFCGHVMIFGEDLKLREPNDREIYDIAGDPALLQAQRMIAEFREWQKHQRRERRRSKKRRR